jgi:hypothetical protein
VAGNNPAAAAQDWRTVGLHHARRFFVAALTRHLYGGAFSEPGGMPAVAGMNANLIAFTPTALIQLAGLQLVLSRK